MIDKKHLTRDTIIVALVDALEPLNYIHAFWEGGAVAFNRVDEWSDIDLYLVVDDEKVSEAFLAVEKTLKALSPIKQKCVVLHPPESGISQAFYRLEDASEYLVIDLAVLTLTSPDKFLEPETHGTAVFYFNKSNKIKPPELNKNALVKKLQKRLEKLQSRSNMFSNFIQKEINRGNHLEALYFYHAFTLSALVEALRIRHTPVHYNFKMRYIRYELPPETTKKLRTLYFVTDEKDLQEKYLKATSFFHKVVSEIKKEGLERILGMP